MSNHESALPARALHQTVLDLRRGLFVALALLACLAGSGVLSIAQVALHMAVLVAAWGWLHFRLLARLGTELASASALHRALSEQSTRYNLALRAGAMGIWEWDAKTGKTEFDEHQYELFGLAPGHRRDIDQDWRRRVEPADLPAVEASLKSALRGEADYAAVFRVRGDDGKLRWLRAAGIVLRDAQGKPEKIIGVNIDVSRQHTADQQRKETDERLRRLAMHVPGLLYEFKLSTDGSSLFPYTSAGLYPLYGLTHAQVADDATLMVEAVHVDDREGVAQSVLASARTLTPWAQEYRIVHPTHGIRWVSAHATPARAEDGSTHWYGFAADVTLDREARQRATETSASLEEAEALACLGSWSFDPESRRIYWSRQMYVIYGRDEALGAPDYATAIEYYVEQDRELLDTEVRKSMESGKSYSLLLRMKERHNGINVVKVVGQASRDASGRVVRLFGAVLDVTASVERETALSLAQAEAEAASRAKTDFLANMSHEIRTPMTAILGYVQLLTDPKVAASDRNEYARTIERNANHLLELINQVLDLSKIEAGLMTVERIPCSPVAVAHDVVSLLRPRAIEKGLQLSLHFASPIPTEIQSDPTRLRQILLNLVGNAIKFTAEGEVTVTLSLDRNGEEPRLTTQITDTGIGIAPEALSSLFQPFNQADTSTTRRFGGTGLGLSIARRLAELLGGEITVASQPGQGSTFTASILTGPLARVPLEAPSEPMRAPEGHTPRGSGALLAGLRILLVEDGPDNQRLIALHLQREGATVELASNGLLALKRLTGAGAAESSSFDVVLMDMQMPVMDGYAATAALRARDYRGPIIALTAHAMESDRRQCLGAGCDDYVTKPLDTQQLISVILKHTRHATSDLPPPVTLASVAVGEALHSEYENDPDMIELLGLFVSGLEQRAAELEAALEQGAWATLESLAHQLRGTGGGYGFPAITVAAAEVENALRTKPHKPNLQQSVAALVATCRSARGPRTNPSSETGPQRTDQAWHVRS